MVAALRAKGELDNTLFIFTSDNGFFQGEHRVKRSKIKVYEPSVRVPALMRGPGVPRDKRVPDLTGKSTWHRRSRRRRRSARPDPRRRVAPRPGAPAVAFQGA